MTRNERKLFIGTIELGILLTLIVILVDCVGGLAPLERYLYDFRARDCQYFSPPPTDRIVHIDIDDNSLAEIGAFPWPRTKIAEMVDEIHLAGAKVLGMDILFAEPQEPRYVKSDDGDFNLIEDDRAFADAVARANNVLLPPSLELGQIHHSAVYDAVYNLLLANPEFDQKEVLAKLRGTPLDNPKLASQVDDEMIGASKEAMFHCVNEAFDQGITDTDALRAKLTPIAYRRDLHSPATALLLNEIELVKSVRNIQRFTWPIPPGAPPLATADAEQAVTIPPLSAVTRYCGYVDFLPSDDGKVRSVPLFVNYRGRMLPHMALAIACAMLNVDLNQIQLMPSSVILPLPDGDKITIPISTRSTRVGKVGAIFDVPWFGTKDWKNEFDIPSHTDSKQQIPLSDVWSICETRRLLESNDIKADEAMFSAVQTYGPSIEKASAFLKKPTTQRSSGERIAAINDTIDQLSGLVDVSSLQKLKPSELNQDDQQFLAMFTALKQIQIARPILIGQIERARAALRSKLNGRAAILGWTVTGNTDTYSTSIHAQCPGAIIQGQIVNGILTREMWRSMPWWATGLITFFIGLTVTFAVAWLPPRQALVCTLGVMFAYFIINGIVLFDWGNLIFGVAGPLVGAAIIWAILTLTRYVIETTQRRKITDKFRSYADPKLVNYVLEHLEEARLDGQVKLMTVVFTDLAGFTTISEKLRERTVPLLNEYMSLMMPVIQKYGGLWNKFLGDGIMFFFNAPVDDPNHAQNSVACVLEMQKSLIDFNARLAEKKLPKVVMRAGISTGSMVVGDAGSIDADHPASDYTVLGDEVNLGARLESANKALGSKILMNSRCASMCGGDFLLRPMGNICVVGKTEGVMTYEALCRLDEATNEQKKLAELSRQIVDHFRAANFAKCIEFAQQMEQTFGSSKFSQLYLTLSKAYLNEPPGEGFEGQIVLSEK